MIVLTVIGGIIVLLIVFGLFCFLWDVIKTTLSNHYMSRLEAKITLELDSIREKCYQIVNERKHESESDKAQLRRLLRTYGLEVLNEANK